jgi:hypothetical protein
MAMREVCVNLWPILHWRKPHLDRKIDLIKSIVFLRFQDLTLDIRDFKYVSFKAGYLAGSDTRDTG